MTSQTEIREKAGLRYRLTPVADLKPGDRVVAFHQDGSLACDRHIQSVTPGGSAYWGGADGERGEVHGYSVTYQERDQWGRVQTSTSGTQAQMAVVLPPTEAELDLLDEELPLDSEDYEF